MKNQCNKRKRKMYERMCGKSNVRDKTKKKKKGGR